jgi:DNA polymerase III epsilon subunit-like protein
MGKLTIKGQLAIDYCSANQKLPDLTLAKKMYEENNSTFHSVENARDYIRYYRNHKGSLNREKNKSVELSKPLTYNTNNYKPFKEEIETGAKILILDIETAPIRAKVWGIWNQNISIDQIESDWFILTWAAKWLFEEKTYSAALTAKEAVAQDDSRILKGIWEMLNEADIIVAHNGDKFDLPKLNTRFLLNKMNPPLPYQSIDTLKHIKRNFAFTSNKLEFVNRMLGLPRKSKHDGFELWSKCYAGDEEALNKMLDYNVNDVVILEETYLRLRPWIKPHPNTALFILDENEHRCPTCGSNKLEDEGKKYYTTVNAYSQFRCTNCGAIGRKRSSDLTVKERRLILSSSPK